MSRNKLLKIPQLSRSVWILAGGRLLSGIGTGFTLFYAPIFFVNQVNISATKVGFAIGSGSISGVFGRFLGGQWVDSPKWGRRKTLLLSALISALADGVLILTNNFSTLVIGNLLMGFGVGLYWPATEAAIIDITTKKQRNEAFAVTRLADSLGLSLGVVLGGALIAADINYRILFFIDGVSFIIFFLIIYYAIAETYNFTDRDNFNQNNWIKALKDNKLTIFLIVNILFTTYLSQVQTTLPLYFKNFVTVESQTGFSEKTISGLFSWHIVFAALTQLPVARWLNNFTRIQALTISLFFWVVGFFLIWLTGIISTYSLLCAVLALAVMALAMVSYTPSASAFIADIAPESLRGIYLSFNSQCWAVGYFIGPALGGYALDNSVSFVRGYWIALCLSTAIGVLILQYLKKTVNRH